jgi:hypothetical protein
MGTYWGHDGKYEAAYHRLWDALVPKQGEAATPHGELLRLTSQHYYDAFNNGWCNVRYQWGTFSDTRGRFVELAAVLPQPHRKRAALVARGRISLARLERFTDAVIAHVAAVQMGLTPSRRALRK